MDTSLDSPQWNQQQLFSSWCTINYYEYSNKVGEQFRASSPRIFVDGYTSPFRNFSDRFSLGLLENVKRQKGVEHVRASIGRGMFNIDRNEMNVFLSRHWTDRRLQWRCLDTESFVVVFCVRAIDLIQSFERLKRFHCVSSSASSIDSFSLSFIDLHAVSQWSVGYVWIDSWSDEALHDPSEFQVRLGLWLWATRNYFGTLLAIDSDQWTLASDRCSSPAIAAWTNNNIELINLCLRDFCFVCLSLSLVFWCKNSSI